LLHGIKENCGNDNTDFSKFSELQMEISSLICAQSYKNPFLSSFSEAKEDVGEIGAEIRRLFTPSCLHATFLHDLLPEVSDFRCHVPTSIKPAEGIKYPIPLRMPTLSRRMLWISDQFFEKAEAITGKSALSGDVGKSAGMFDEALKQVTMLNNWKDTSGVATESSFLRFCSDSVKGSKSYTDLLNGISDFNQATQVFSRSFSLIFNHISIGWVSFPLNCDFESFSTLFSLLI
jgi:hypothetical protein